VHPDYAQLLGDCAHNVTDADAAVRAVELALGDPAARGATRRRVAAELFYRPGTASARCAAALYDVLQLEAHPAVVAPLEDTLPCLQSA
jgi:hypothetical protein